MRRALLLAALLLPNLALACSGPGAAEAITRAEIGGWILAGMSLGMAGLTSRLAWIRKIKSPPVAMAWVLLLAHPGLWVSARSGDCGRERWLLAGIFTLLEAGLVGWAWLRPGRQGS